MTNETVDDDLAMKELTLGAFHRDHHVFEHAYLSEEGDLWDKILAGSGALKQDIIDNLEGDEKIKEVLLVAIEAFELEYGKLSEDQLKVAV